MQEYLSVALANKEPSIAGFYVDKTGTVIVQVTDVRRAAEAINAVKAEIGASNGRFAAQNRRAAVRANPVQYSFQQLSDWRDLVVDSLLGSHGVVMDDLDEVKNR